MSEPGSHADRRLLPVALFALAIMVAVLAAGVGSTGASAGNDGQAVAAKWPPPDPNVHGRVLKVFRGRGNANIGNLKVTKQRILSWQNRRKTRTFELTWDEVNPMVRSAAPFGGYTLCPRTLHNGHVRAAGQWRITVSADTRSSTFC